MTITKLHHENPFESHASKFLEPDFSLAPPYRGFWTDEEVFPILGTTSLVVLKSLQRKKLLHVSKYKNRSGKWARAWTCIDVYLAALTIDLSFHASLSVAASAEVLSLIPESLARRSLSLEPFLDQLIEPYVWHTDEGGATDMFEPGHSISVSRELTAELNIYNRKHVYFTERSTELSSPLSHYIGYLLDIDSSKPKAVRSTKPSFVGDEKTHPTSRLALNLSRLGIERFVSQFSDLPIKPVFKKVATNNQRETK